MRCILSISFLICSPKLSAGVTARSTHQEYVVGALEQLAPPVAKDAVARRCKPYFAWAGLEVFDKFGLAVDSQCGVGHHNALRFEQPDGGGKILDSLIRQFSAA